MTGTHSPTMTSPRARNGGRVPLHLLAVLAAFATLGMVGIALAAPAAQTRDATNIAVDVTMDARLGGLKFGSISMQAAFGDTAYTARSVVRTEGITDHVFRQVFDLTAAGARTPDLMQTQNYQARNTDQDNIQLIDVNYLADAAPLVAADPPYDNSDRVAPRPTDLKNTVDPLSAMIVPMATPGPAACNRTIPVYDGRRRYDFKMTFDRMSDIQSNKGFSGAAARCDAILVPVSGYKRDTIMEMRRDPMPITVWLGPVADANVLVPVRIEVATPLGTLVAHTTKFTVSKQASGTGSSQAALLAN